MNSNLDEYFETPLEVSVPPPIPTDFEDVQQEPHKTAWVRGGAVYGGLGLAGIFVCLIVYMLLGGGGDETAVANKETTPSPKVNPNAQLKSALWFAEQGNGDKNFLDKGKKPKSKQAKKPNPVKLAEVPPNQTRSYNSDYSNRVVPLRSLPVSKSLDVPPKAVFNPPPYVASNNSSPQPVQAIDPNAEWARIQAGSTYSVPGVEQPQPVAYVPPENATQNAAWEHPATEQPSSNAGATLGKQIKLNTSISATIMVPVSASKIQRTVLRLDTPLKSSEEVVLPKGTLLIGQTTPDGDSINLSITSAMLGDQEIAMPTEEIAVSASNGKMLSVKSRKGGFGKVVGKFALNALGGALDTALSSTSSTTINSGGSSTIINNVSRSLQNSVMGGVRGGVAGLIGDITAENGGDESGLNKGTRVKLVFVYAAMI
jgi:hypothetical protein